MVSDRDIERWGLICGTIREPFEFYTTLGWLYEAREEGRLQGIVFSTWRGHVDNIPGLREKLDALGVMLIETLEPEEDRLSYLFPGFVRQGIQIRRALTRIPSGAFVLKCRTDFSNYDLNHMDVLGHEDLLDLGPHAGLWPEWEHKVAVQRISITMPFAFHDICFYGCRDDLLRMVDMALDLEDVPEGTDTRMFSGAFAGRFPLIQETRYWLGYDYRRVIRQCTREGEVWLPHLLVRFYALYFLLMHSFFTVFHAEGTLGDEPLSMEDVFLGNADKGIIVKWILQVRHDELLQRIVDGNVEASGLYQELHREIQAMCEPGYAWHAHVTEDELQELRELGLLKHQVLPVKQKSYPDNIWQMLFSDYNVSDEVAALIASVAYNQETYYYALTDNLECFRASDERLYRLALFCAARLAQPEVLDAIADLLLDDKVAEDEIISAEFTFKRGEDRLYAGLDDLHRLAALYKYCVYEERKGAELTVRKAFLSRLQTYYELDVRGCNPMADIRACLQDVFAKQGRELPDVK